jgi:proteasome lid subunit RPN8/RPN11
MMISDDALNNFKAHVLTDYPNEACGLLIGGIYHRCRNSHEEPTRAFRINGKERWDLQQKFGTIEAVLHSHPYKLSESKLFYKEKYNPAWPSETDQASYIDDNVPWGIVASDGEGISELNWLSENKPLFKRQFAWFTADCYSLVRDWHKENTGIILPNFVRKWQFWKESLNTIEDGIASIPFAIKHPTEQAQIGDVAIIEMGGFDVVNHLGVITGGNEFLHQFVEQYAHTTGWNLWRHKTKYVVRFDKEKAQCFAQ